MPTTDTEKVSVFSADGKHERVISKAKIAEYKKLGFYPKGQEPKGATK